MKPRRPMWSSLCQALLVPKVSPGKLEQCLHQVRGTLPIPVIWLLGKAQSGKTSIVRALTGSSRAAIGNGFQPCTRTARLYAFPTEQECILKFLDTRGLSEVDYDPGEDMRLFERQAHVLLVVIKALDHAQDSVVTAVAHVRKAHPHWPLVVVQTALHEGYPQPTTPHVVPYPYDRLPLPPTVPQDLARSLLSQRALFPYPNTRFVPVDLTLPQDGFSIEHYGLEPLWTAMEDALPLGLRGMLHGDREARKPLRSVYARSAQPHVLWYAAAAGAAAGVPVPFLDVPLVLAIQGKMFQALASLYGQPLNSRLVAEVGSTLGLGYAARLGGRELLKFVPGFGAAVSALYAGATTYALGCTLCAYFSHVQDGDLPEPGALKAIYAEQYAAGRRRLKSYFRHLGTEPRPASPTSEEPQP